MTTVDSDDLPTHGVTLNSSNCNNAVTASAAKNRVKAMKIA
jgi:hypothetical protein